MSSAEFRLLVPKILDNWINAIVHEKIVQNVKLLHHDSNNTIDNDSNNTIIVIQIEKEIE